MENTETQVDPGTPQEKAVAEATATPIPDIEQLKGEVDRKENEIKRLQGILKDSQKRGIPKEELDTLHSKIDDMQDWVAGAMDDLMTRIAGEETEVKPTRKTYRQQLQDKKAEPKPKAEAPPDPDVQKFISYLNSQGLASDDPLVQEAIAEDRSPQDALKYLKGKIEAKTQAQIEKVADEKAQRIVEQKLKDLGLTVSGAKTPNAPAEKTDEQRLQERYPSMKK